MHCNYQRTYRKFVVKNQGRIETQWCVTGRSTNFPESLGNQWVFSKFSWDNLAIWPPLFQASQFRSAGITTSDSLWFLDIKQFHPTRLLGCDPPWSFMSNFFWTGESWLLQKSPAQWLTLIHYNVCNMEQCNNSTESGDRGHLVQCPTHSMANFEVLGQAITVPPYCLRAICSAF